MFASVLSVFRALNCKCVGRRWTRQLWQGQPWPWLPWTSQRSRSTQKEAFCRVGERTFGHDGHHRNATELMFWILFEWFRLNGRLLCESMSALTLSWCDWSFLTRTYSDPLRRSETFCDTKVLPGRPHWLCLGWLGLVHWLSAAQRSEKPWLQHLARVGEAKDRLQPEICFGVVFAIVHWCFLLEFLEYQL